jgi:26S proteasome regulatory subunit N5
LISRFLKKLLTFEIMPLNMEQIAEEVKAYEPFGGETENSDIHGREFIKQLIQHNIRVIEKYYKRIRLGRLAQLVGVGVDRAEAEIGDMVVSKRLTAKINRMQGVVVFSKSKFTNDILNDWNYDIRTLLDKIEQTCHLINRENVVHN